MLRITEAVQLTDTGRQREANEDSLFLGPPLFAVADGMGGAQAGEVASHLAVEAFSAADPDSAPPEELLRTTIEAANRSIYELAQGDSSRSGMGTTLTAALLRGEEISFGHVGDSRAYVFRDGQLKQITNDHSLVEELRRQGRLSREQAADHPQRSVITRALGPEPDVEVDTMTFRGRDGDVYDLAGVFDLIPRSRIADLRPREDGALDIVLGCDCHGTAFATGSGAIAIDIADGPPSGASPFEAPDQAAVPQAEPAPSGTTEAVPDTVTEQQASLVPLPSTAIPQDPHLPVYWNGPVPPPLVEPSVEEQTATAPADSLAEAAAESATPDRIPEMRDDLLEQLSRAASQGLITLDPAPTRPAPQSPAHEAPQAPEMADPVPLPEADRAPLHIETSVDRDSGFTAPAHPLTADGGQCPADEIFDVATWAGEEPPAIQIAALRQGIVGEFDRPDPERVIALAQLYVNLGFGAEASATLDSFGIENETAAWLHSLARIVEQPGNAPPSLRGYAGCVGPVALWALLEDGGGLASSQIDIPSVLGSFSSLPLHLRVHLGPALLERLTSIGEVEAARTARAAILRAGLVETPDLGLAEARIALAEGDDGEGTRQLEALAAGNGPAATEALMQAIRLHLDKGGAVPPELTATTGALAKEFAHDPLGPRLAVLEILGLASTGDFTTAFDEEAYWRNRLSDAQAREVLLGLFAALVGNGDDWTFFAQYFRDRDRLEAAGPDILLRLDLAERELNEIKVIEEFLPRQLADEEVEKAVVAAIAETEASSIRDMGKVMGILKAQYTGQMDFGAVGPMVKDRLGG